MPKLSTQAVNKFLDRELMRLQQIPYKQPMAPLNAERIFGMDPDGVTDGHETHNQTVEVITGKAAWITSGSKDLPRVDGGLIEDVYPVRHFGCSYGYDYFEAAAALQVSRDLKALKVRAAERACAVFHNRVSFFGDEELGLRGALVHDYIPRISFDISLFRAPNTNVNATLAQLYLLANTVRELSEDAECPNVYVLDPDTHDYISQTRLDNTTGDQTTILQAFLANAPRPEDGRELRVERARELRKAGPDGEPLIAAYSDRKDADARSFCNTVIVPFKQHEVDPRNLERIVPVTATTGGFKTPYPMSHIIAELRDAA